MNTYTGKTTISAGTLLFSSTSSLYNGSTASWTASNITTGSGAVIALAVGGSNGFTDSNIQTIIGSGFFNFGTNNGMLAGSSIGFDTTNSGSAFVVTAGIKNTTYLGGGSVGLVKLGAGTLVLNTLQYYTGPTIIAGGTLQVGGTSGGQLAATNITNNAGLVLFTNGEIGRAHV